MTTLRILNMAEQRITAMVSLVFQTADAEQSHTLSVKIVQTSFCKAAQIISFEVVSQASRIFPLALAVPAMPS